MRTLVLPTIFCIVAGPGLGQAGLGEVVCDDSARLEEQLRARHGTLKQGRGMRGPDAILEVWVSPSTGDWTLVQTYANGTSCIVAIGEQWENLAPASDPA